MWVVVSVSLLGFGLVGEGVYEVVGGGGVGGGVGSGDGGGGASGGVGGGVQAL